MSKIRFEPVSVVDEAMLAAHRAYSRGLGLADISWSGAASARLAVVGGSPDVEAHIEDLRAWGGDIWAINGAFQWCRKHGIEAYYYRIDPVRPRASEFRGASKAILGDFVHPDVFRLIRADVWLARFGKGWHMLQSTAAGTAPMLAVARGHKSVTFFGCESSFAARTHAYKAESPNLVWVECGGREYVTSPQMIMQAEWLASAVREFPSIFMLSTGGFLAALAEHGDYRVTHVCKALDEAIKGAA